MGVCTPAGWKITVDFNHTLYCRFNKAKVTLVYFDTLSATTGSGLCCFSFMDKRDMQPGH